MFRSVNTLGAATLLVIAGPTYAKDAPLPEGIEIINEDQASSCRFIDVAYKMRFAAFSSASKTQRDALIAALEEAVELGGNAAVISGMTAHNNQHQVSLSVYECSEAATGLDEVAYASFNDRLAFLLSNESINRPQSYAILNGRGVGTTWVATVHGYPDNEVACSEIVARLNSDETPAPFFSCQVID